jgi:hypothetical protein
MKKHQPIGDLILSPEKIRTGMQIVAEKLNQ